MLEIILNTITDEKRGAIVEDGKIVEWLVEEPTKTARVGDIYKGRITKVLPGMEAVFVDIGVGKDGYLHSKEIRKTEGGTKPVASAVKQGEEVLVQVAKEEMSTKGAKLTEYIQLPGQSIVYLPYSDYVAVSKRLGDDDLRKEWRTFGQETVESPEGMIIRTAAKELTMAQVKQELDVLRELLSESLDEAKEKKAPALVFEGGSMMLQVARNYAHRPNTTITIDNRKDYTFLTRWLKMNPFEQAEVRLHAKQEGIFTTFDLEKKLERVFSKQVWLKSGGSLIIEETEAMTVIDVNTGKFTGKTSLEDTVVKANKEAAVAVAEQLRLRDLGGIIIVDFIDMEEDESRERVLKALNDALKQDRTRTTVIGFTRLGLVEMTRKKARSTVANRLTESCMVCEGKGFVRSAQSLYFALERELLEMRDTEAVVISASDELCAYLESDQHQKVLESRAGVRVFFTRSESAGYVVRFAGSVDEADGFWNRQTGR
ncbi:Rne/Rng family ribonuclease [Alteribacter aurantiacus]|uniref:Rne/Rng family ribonuclease n=1 Tax=Alteribacter aurantiacus TaxID=254410 RepID=UPI00041B4090|nr:Rne/Rng family ribonuclease [Alteribacter aurantiacus]